MACLSVTKGMWTNLFVGCVETERPRPDILSSRLPENVNNPVCPLPVNTDRKNSVFFHLKQLEHMQGDF